MHTYAACTPPVLARASGPAVGLELFDRGWGRFVWAAVVVFWVVVGVRCCVQAVEIYFALASGFRLFVAALRFAATVPGTCSLQSQVFDLERSDTPVAVFPRFIVPRDVVSRRTFISVHHEHQERSTRCISRLSRRRCAPPTRSVRLYVQAKNVGTCARFLQPR